jgi:hypothetical protein
MWKQNTANPKGLVDLANLAARLMRLSLYEKLSYGDVQLRAAGIPESLSDAYKVHAVHQLQKSRKKKTKMVTITTTHRSTF